MLPASEDAMNEGDAVLSETNRMFSNPEELRVFCAALDSFRLYRRVAHHNVTHRRRQNFYALPTEQWRMLASPPFYFLDTLEHVDNAIDANADIADQIVASALSTFVQDWQPETWHNKATPNDLDKARSTIQQFYRDWSTEGFAEREACYGLILRALEQKFDTPAARSGTRVLIPGAGLGRLVFEICFRGFYAEGNEISYHQLLASNWVLNSIPQEQRFKLFPFALDFQNVEKRSHQLRAAYIPDIHPANMMAMATGSMNMTAGDFLTAYSGEEHASSFDAIVTAFFIDTAPNVIKYIEVIRRCLRVDGIWINAGPLLWHFSERSAFKPDEDMIKPDEDMEDKTTAQTAGIEAPGSFELTNNELMNLIARMGFQVEQHRIEAEDEAEGYIRNTHSMLQNRFRCSFWVVRKKAEG